MVYISDNSISGQFGSVVALTGASTPFTATGLQYIYNLPRSQRVYPQGQLFRILDRTKKVLDHQKLPSAFTVLNNAVAVAATNWTPLYGGYVRFNSAQVAAGGTANEVQSVALTGVPTGGTFTLTFDDGTGNSQTTAPIAYNAASTAVVSALNALPNIGAGGVTATGGPLPTGVVVTFGGPTMQNNPYAVMTFNAAGLTGGTNPTVTVTETTPGTSGFTMSGNYIPTSVATTVLTVPEVKDWKFTKNGTIIKNDVYGTGFSRPVTSIADGQLDFMANAIDNTLYDYQMSGDFLHFALYETTKSTPPRIWLSGGYVVQTPVDNPVAAMSSGQVQITISEWPTLLREVL
jgi:hypothetical protein